MCWLSSYHVVDANCSDGANGTIRLIVDRAALCMFIRVPSESEASTTSASSVETGWTTC